MADKNKKTTSEKPVALNLSFEKALGGLLQVDPKKIKEAELKKRYPAKAAKKSAKSKS